MEALNLGLGGLSLKEVGMGQAPEKNEAMSEKKRNKEDVKSSSSMDKVNKGFGDSAKASNTGGMLTKKSSLVEGGKEKEAEVVKVVEHGKKRSPSICSCELEFYHSKNLHANTTMDKQN